MWLTLINEWMHDGIVKIKPYIYLNVTYTHISYCLPNVIDNERKWQWQFLLSKEMYTNKGKKCNIVVILLQVWLKNMICQTATFTMGRLMIELEGGQHSKTVIHQFCIFHVLIGIAFCLASWTILAHQFVQDGFFGYVLVNIECHIRLMLEPTLIAFCTTNTFFITETWNVSLVQWEIMNLNVKTKAAQGMVNIAQGW